MLNRPLIWMRAGRGEGRRLLLTSPDLLGNLQDADSKRASAESNRCPMAISIISLEMRERVWC